MAGIGSGRGERLGHDGCGGGGVGGTIFSGGGGGWRGWRHAAVGVAFMLTLTVPLMTAVICCACRARDEGQR